METIAKKNDSNVMRDVCSQDIMQLFLCNILYDFDKKVSCLSRVLPSLGEGIFYDSIAY